MYTAQRFVFFTSVEFKGIKFAYAMAKDVDESDQAKSNIG